MVMNARVFERFDKLVGRTLVDRQAARNAVAGMCWTSTWVVLVDTDTSEVVVFEASLLYLAPVVVGYPRRHDYGLSRGLVSDLGPVGLHFHTDPFGSPPWFLSSAAPNVVERIGVKYFNDKNFWTCA